MSSKIHSIKLIPVAPTREMFLNPWTLSTTNFQNNDHLIQTMREVTADGTNLSGSLVATRGGEKVWLEKNSLIPVKASAELLNPMGSVVATLVQADNSVLTRYVVK